ncbi:MAG TPA: glycoside hydrolase family 3 C-terminal domain-containing protein, partial [Roseivirga sp.]
REKIELRSKENLELARKMAEESIVLLKNDDHLLPLKPNQQKICLIGPLGDNKADMNGTWSFFADPEDPVTMLEGLRLHQPNTTFSLGCELYESTDGHFAAAIETAKEADVIIMALGESAVMNGEAASRADIGLPENQLELFNSIHKLGIPIIVLVSAGRPLVLTELEEKANAILLVWSLGSQAGEAIANVVFGEVNPSAKLPITFPRHGGQVPMHYQLRNTGRPYLGDYSEPKSERIYQSKYRDVENSPLYPFGFGLSYTSFEYTQPELSHTQMKTSETIAVSCKVKNTGALAGEEIVQLYIRDMKASVTRPLKELKGFQKIKLESKEEKLVSFHISNEDLAFYRRDMSYGSEPGEFQIFVGPDSETQNSCTFELID